MFQLLQSYVLHRAKVNHGPPVVVHQLVVEDGHHKLPPARHSRLPECEHAKSVNTSTSKLFALEKISTKKYHFIAQQRLKLRMPITNSHQLSICACLNVNSVHSEENLNSHCLDDDYVENDPRIRHVKGVNISTSKLFAL